MAGAKRYRVHGRKGRSRGRGGKPDSVKPGEHAARAAAAAKGLEERMARAQAWLDAQAPLKRVDRGRPSV